MHVDPVLLRSNYAGGGSPSTNPAELFLGPRGGGIRTRQLVAVMLCDRHRYAPGTWTASYSVVGRLFLGYTQCIYMVGPRTARVTNHTLNRQY